MFTAYIEMFPDVINELKILSKSNARGVCHVTAICCRLSEVIYSGNVR